MIKNNFKWMEKVFVLLFLFIFSFSLAGAVVDTINVDDTFRLNQVVNYTKPCFNNSNFCPSSTTCTYTILNPDNSVYLNNATSENHGSYTNIIISLQQLGIYRIDRICLDANLNVQNTYYAQVTGSGFNSNIGFLTIVLILSAGVIIFGFWIKDGWIAILGTFGLYFLGFYIMFYGIDIIKNTSTTFASSLVILAVAGYISIKSGIEMIS